MSAGDHSKRMKILLYFVFFDKIWPIGDNYIFGQRFAAKLSGGGNAKIYVS
jgi:hypothetical protein